MNNKFLGLLTIAVIILMYFSVSLTHALLADTASSTSNTFSTAATFPTLTPTISVSPTETNPSISPTLSPTPPPSTFTVVINEIMWAGSFNGDDEWIELRNVTNEPIVITGWKIDGAGSGLAALTIPTATIPASGFYLISHFAEFSPSSILNIAPDFTSTSISLSNMGEQLVLRNTSNTVVDTANTTPGWLSGTSSIPRKSMERNNVVADGTLGSSWHIASTQTNLDSTATESATPKAANSL